MDFGCGAGMEAVDLLQRGFVVHAVDRESKAIEILENNTVSSLANLNIHHCSFEDLHDWPQVDFFFAFHSLPFCKQEFFKNTLEKSFQSVKAEGLYVGSFFGLEDEWVADQRVVGISADDLKKSLIEFDLLHFEETKEIGKTVMNGPKMWHVIEVIGRKK